MAFINDQNNAEYRRISLSFRAFNIVQSDMRTFNNKSFSGFINRIIMNFKDYADASVASAVLQETKKWENKINQLSGRNIDPKWKKALNKLDSVEIDNAIKTLKTIDKEEIIRILKAVKTLDLMEKNLSYESYKSEGIRLQNDVLEYLVEEDSECVEDGYYGQQMSKYLKALIEEYTLLPFYKRELVYFKDTVDLVNKAIQEERKFSFKAIDGTIYKVRPVEILTDTMKTYNYIIGYTYKDDGGEPYTASYRLSGFSTAKLRKETAHVSVEDKKKLNVKIKNRGVQFLLTAENEIVVRLTARGKTRFTREVHLRPPLDRIDDNGNYIFNCTEAQAEFYFVKFGKDAYVVEPESLRNKLKNIYMEAFEAYNINE